MAKKKRKGNRPVHQAQGYRSTTRDLKDLATEFKRRAAEEGDNETVRAMDDLEAQQKKEKVQQQKEKAQQQEAARMRDLLLPCDPRNKNGIQPGTSSFVNPYTFFPLEQEAPERLRFDSEACRGHNTGRLTCTFKVEPWSPLFVPNTSSVFGSADHLGHKGHKAYEFCSADDLSAMTPPVGGHLPTDPPAHPYVPGSELRGMVRSVYEQLTNSCLPVIDETSNPIKRTTLPKKPYRMEYDEDAGAWQLFETEVYRYGGSGTDKIGDLNKLREKYAKRGEQGEYLDRGVTGTRRARGILYAKGVCPPDEAGRGAVLCHVHATGDFAVKKHNRDYKHNHITLYPCERTGKSVGEPIRVGDRLFQRFKRVVDAYCEDGTGFHQKVVDIYKGYRELLKRHKTVLVYADDGEDPHYLSPSCISPESFDTRVVDLLKVQKDHEPCKGPELCPACRLFGTVTDKISLGSRVRFTDATPEPGFSFRNPVTLPPLSSPRPSSTEFYLMQPKDGDGQGLDGLWNFDYLIGPNGQKNPTPYKELPGAGIQGRKVYLHHEFDLKRHYDKYDQLQPNGQNVTVRPLEKGTFSFEVYFEDLTDDELQTLVFALGGMGKKGRLQKLGRGKPLGMGSVRMRVNGCELRNYNYDAGKNVVACHTEAKDPQWFQQPPLDVADERALRVRARRRLVEILAQDLRDFPNGEGTLSDLVSYPKTASEPIKGPSNLSYSWFGKNRGTVQRPNISHVLATWSVEEIMDELRSQNAEHGDA